MCRYPIKPVSKLLGQPDSPKLVRWANRIAPVANIVLSGLRAGTNSSSHGALTAKLQLSSAFLVNLQLLDLCKSPATWPSEAGVHLPFGYAVPEQHPRNPSTAAGAAAAGPTRLAANYNAFVLGPYTARLTAAYQSATLHRWQLLGLTSLVSDSPPGNISSANSLLGRPSASAHALRGASSSSSPGQQPGAVARGVVSRGLLLRQRWQRVLELRAFVKTLDYAMFLVFYQQAQQAARGAEPAAESFSGGGSASDPAGAAPAEQYQVLYRMYLAEINASAAPEQPTPQRTWFGSRRSTCTASLGGAAAAAAAAPATPASTGSPAAPSVVSAGSIPGSPSMARLDQGAVCDWRRGHMRDTLRHRLSTAERVHSTHSTPSISRDGSAAIGSVLSGMGSLPSYSNGPMPGRVPSSFSHQPFAPPVRICNGEHSYTGAAGGLLPVSERPTAAAAAPAAPPNRSADKVVASAAAAATTGQVARAESFTIDGSRSGGSPLSPLGGMQMFNALRSLRSGSSFLLTAAAQQLRLRQLRGAQEQAEVQQQPQPLQQPQQQQVQQHHQQGRSLSRLGPRPDLDAAGGPGRSFHQQQQQQQQQGLPHHLPQGWQAGISAFAVAGVGADSAGFGASSQHPHTQRCEVLLDFLTAFAIPEDPVHVFAGTADDDSAAGFVPAQMPSQQQAALARPREPQLSISYLQQPVHGVQQRRHLRHRHRQQQQQQEWTARQPHTARMSQGLSDELTVCLGHLKLVLGPHSISMGLQLFTSLMEAATSSRPGNSPRHPAAASSSSTAPDPDAVPTATAATAGSNGRPCGLTTRLQLSVCHVAVNMERMLLPGAVGPGGRATRHELLETTGLLSLLLLDTNSSVHCYASSSAEVLTGSAGRAGAAGSSSQDGRVQAFGSVAHVGLQDLCAPLEQRHVISGAREPYQVRKDLPGSPKSAC